MPPDFGPERLLVMSLSQLGCLQPEAQKIAEHFQSLYAQQPFGIASH